MIDYCGDKVNETFGRALFGRLPCVLRRTRSRSLPHGLLPGARIVGGFHEEGVKADEVVQEAVSFPAR